MRIGALSGLQRVRSRRTSKGSPRVFCELSSSPLEAAHDEITVEMV